MSIKNILYLEENSIGYIYSRSLSRIPSIRKWCKVFEYVSAKINGNVLCHLSDELRLQNVSTINNESLCG